MLATCVVVSIMAPTGAEAQISQWAQQRGLEMPLPWGMGVTMYNQIQDYDIVSLQASVAGLDLGQLPALEVDNETSSYHLKLDHWVLPFLNVFALYGEVEGKTTVDLRGIDLGVPLPLGSLTVEYDGTMYGGGATLAGGGKRWFSSLTYNYTETDLEVSNSSVTAWVLLPKIGWHWGTRGAVWVGGMYQDAEEKHEGVFDIPYLGEVPFSVDLEEQEQWSYLLGASAKLGEHWVLIMEGGFGQRHFALLTLDYRF